MSLSFWNPNSVFAGFDDEFFGPPTLLGIPPSLTPFKTDTIRHSSPRYEVSENEKQFRLSVDVPGVMPEDMKVDLEHDGRVLHLTGGRKVKTDNSFEEYKFEKRFTLGKDLETSKMTAHLSNGVLCLTAPKKLPVPPTTQTIPIVQGEAPALMMDVDEKKE